MSLEQIDRLNRVNFFLENQNLLLKQKLIELNNINKELELQNKDIRKVNNNLIDTYRCMVCYKNPKNIILQPCFHFCLCSECLQKLTTCPICRDEIDLYNQIF